MSFLRGHSRLLLLFALLVVGALLGSQIVSPQPKPANGSLVFSADAVVYGGTLGSWSARAWQLSLQFPIGHNPGQDPTGASCGSGQAGPVFFLPRNLPPCTVPEGVIIFVPIAGTECSTADAPPFHAENEKGLRECATTDADRYAVVTAEIDGVPVPDIGRFRATTPLFQINLPRNNVLGTPQSIANGVADGYQMLVAPLSPGEHEILIHLELADGTVLPDKLARIMIVPAEH